MAPIQFVPVMTFDSSSGTYVGPILMPMQMVMPQSGHGNQDGRGGGRHSDLPQADCKCGCQNIMEKTSATLLQALLEGKENKGSKARRAMRGRSSDPKEGTNTSPAADAEALLQLQQLSELCKEREPQSELKPWEPGAVVRGSSSSSVGSASVATASGASSSTTSPASHASDEGLPVRPGLLRDPKKPVSAALLGNCGAFLPGGYEGSGCQDLLKSGVSSRNAAESVAMSVPDFTTVMLKHIPNQCSRDQLVHELNRQFKGSFDFLYLPMDFAARRNQGFCFINFVSHEACGRFMRAFDGRSVQSCFPSFTGSRLLAAKEAKVQGFEANVTRLRKSPVMTELLQNREWMPLTLDAEGDAMPFPDHAESLASWRSRASAQKNRNWFGSP
eukprot:TRINITY_DN18071_c0_g1_i2.p1 TRINITY_DN18071_c0_g1~~TRINITY_DN18071_c0_g1_i2.p1  ORF type:complete len:421 (+),score=64.45 TRINITY_DN18071_c0_g1_i2:100-1263(+)